MTIAVAGNPSKMEKARPTNVGDDSFEAAIGRAVSCRGARLSARGQSLTRKAHGLIVDDELDPSRESIHLRLSG